eukprot:5098156-Lingulodinium_polyedra.AAC.1
MPKACVSRHRTWEDADGRAEARPTHTGDPPAAGGRASSTLPPRRTEAGGPAGPARVRQGAGGREPRAQYRCARLLHAVRARTRWRAPRCRGRSSAVAQHCKARSPDKRAERARARASTDRQSAATHHASSGRRQPWSAPPVRADADPAADYSPRGHATADAAASLSSSLGGLRSGPPVQAVAASAAD